MSQDVNNYFTEEYYKTMCSSGSQTEDAELQLMKAQNGEKLAPGFMPHYRASLNTNLNPSDSVLFSSLCPVADSLVQTAYRKGGAFALKNSVELLIIIQG